MESLDDAAWQAFDHAARYVSVWVREEGGWRMVSDQSTPMPDA